MSLIEATQPIIITYSPVGNRFLPGTGEDGKGETRVKKSQHVGSPYHLGPQTSLLSNIWHRENSIKRHRVGNTKSPEHAHCLLLEVSESFPRINEEK